MGFKTAVLFIIFNRFSITQEVFKVIRQVKPKYLFIAADGPREDNKDDIEKCLKARDIIKQVDWECEVKTLFQEKNLGCGLGPATAITWFFEQVEEGIILEDDCVPNLDFFTFCEILLNYYRDNNRIMHISGNNFQFGRKRGKASYYFSIYTHNSGWATWRRAWKHYDFECTSIEHRKHAWDAQWLISVKNNNGLAISPNVNLVSHIGYGEDATHTVKPDRFAYIPTENLSFPLTHPEKIESNKAADKFTFYNNFGGQKESIKNIIINKIRRAIPRKLKKIIKNIITRK